jgi:restriction system protein
MPAYLFLWRLAPIWQPDGVFITTSRFSPDAYNYAEKVAARVILIDGPTLASLLVEHNIGAQNSETFVLKRVDEDFFEEV